MKIGATQTISDAFFPKGIQVEAWDRKGRSISIGDKVRLFGCRADYGYVGYSDNRLVLYFEADGTSVRWDFDSMRVELWEKG